VNESAASQGPLPAKRVRKVAAASRGGATIERQDVGALARATKASLAWAPQTRAKLVVGVLGNKRTAELLNVSQSQPSRWTTGEETAVAPLLVALDHVIARLLIIWDKTLVFDWLTGPNSYLDGARPIDVITARGTTEVIEAIEAEASGAYA
jgi:uncharacterized protein (DUF2384 family)